ncbi:MAG: carboxypeptidase regulatory-like domain-containing protein, partial [Pirellulales bacterium]|nr:carboxypeptidase regulatory-like domain-containing protein [Pirellulales bacterium]
AMHLGLSGAPAKNLRSANRVYLSLPDRLLTLKWKIWQAIRRASLSPADQQRLRDQRRWMTDYISGLPLYHSFTREQALSELAERFDDPLCCTLDRPMTDNAFADFQTRLKKYPRASALAYVVTHMVQKSLYAQYADFSYIELPFEDRLSSYSAGRTVQLGFVSNRLFLGDNRSLRQMEQSHSVVDATTGYPITVPREFRQADQLQNWLDRQGKGDFVLSGKSGGTLVAVRDAKLVPLVVDSWMEADAIPDDVLHDEFERRGTQRIGLQEHYRAHRNQHTTHPPTEYLGPYIGLRTREGRLAVVHIEDFSGPEEIHYRVRPRAVSNGVKLSVIDAAGNPIAGTHVRLDKHELVEQGGRRRGRYVAIGQSVSDRGGRVTIPIPSDANVKSLAVRVEAEGYVSRSSHHNLFIHRGANGRWSHDKVVLLRAGRLSGRVLGPDGKPLAGAPLSMATDCDYGDHWRGPGKPANPGGFMVGNHLRTISNDDGTFLFEGVPPGDLILYYPWDGPTQGEVDRGHWRQWTKPGQPYPSPPLANRAWVSAIKLGEGERREDIVVDLSKSSARVEGRVVSTTGQPIADAAIGATWKFDNGAGFTFPDSFRGGHARTDAQGRFQLSGLPPGAMSISCRHERFTAPQELVQVSLTAGVTTPVEIVINDDHTSHQTDGGDSTSIVIDMVDAVGLSERPSFWIGPEDVSRESLLKRLAKLRDTSSNLRVVVRTEQAVETQPVTDFRQALEELGVEKVEFRTVDHPAIFAYPGNQHRGLIRGRVLDPHAKDPEMKYHVSLWWENAGFGEFPTLVVDAAEPFEFRHLAPKKYELHARQWQPNGRAVHFDRNWVPVKVEADVQTDKTTEVQIVFGKGDLGRWRDAYAWGHAVEGVRMRLVPDRYQVPLGKTTILCVDIHNGGRSEQKLDLEREAWELEIDGKWFKPDGASSGRRRVLQLDPDQTKTRVLVRLWDNLSTAFEQLPAGKHVLRVGRLIKGTGVAQGDSPQIRIVSQPIVIEVVGPNVAENAMPDEPPANTKPDH